MVPNCMLQQNNLNGIFGIFRGEFVFANKGVNVDAEGVDAFIWQRSERISLQQCQKCTSSLMTDWIVLRVRERVCWASGEMVLLSINV